MDLLESQDLIVVVVRDESEDVKTLSLPLETIKENAEGQSLLLDNMHEVRSMGGLFDTTVKIEYIPDEISDTEACEEFFSKKNSGHIYNTLSNGDIFDVCVVKEESVDEIKVETVTSRVSNQAKTHNEFYVEEYQGSEREIEYLEEEYDEDCNLEEKVKNEKEEHSLEVNNSYINDLQLQFPELKEDKELLIEVLARIMKELKAPPVPNTYYIQCYGKYKCIICHTATYTLPAAERHYLEKHGSRYLVCYACGANFRSRGNLYRHEKKACKAKDIDIVLKARAMFLGKKGQNRPYLDMYQSAWCTLRTPNVQKNIRKNTIKSPQNYLCTICPTAYVTKKALDSHMNKHLGRRPYRCQKCNNAYSCPNALKQHVESHENIQLICDICKRSFKWRASLIGHMNTHLPTKKHGCPECDRRYAKSVSLKLHINRVHKKLPYPYGCQICHKRYAKLFILKQHMKKEHQLDIMSRGAYIRRLPKMSEQDVLNGKIVLSNDLVNQDPVILEN